MLTSMQPDFTFELQGDELVMFSEHETVLSMCHFQINIKV